MLATALTNRPSDDPAGQGRIRGRRRRSAPFIAGFAGATQQSRLSWTRRRKGSVDQLDAGPRPGHPPRAAGFPGRRHFHPDLVTEVAARRAGGQHLCAQGLERQRRNSVRPGNRAQSHQGRRHRRPDRCRRRHLAQVPAVESEAYIPAWKVLAGENDASEVAGRIMLVGTSAPGLIDLRATPLDPTIAGVEVHAQAIEHILSGRSLTRPDYALALEMATCCRRPRARPSSCRAFRPAMRQCSASSAVAAIILGGWLRLSEAGLLLDPTFPALALLIFVAAATFYVYRRVEEQRAEVRSAFGHYVSPSVVDEIIAHPEQAGTRRRGARADAAVLRRAQFHRDLGATGRAHELTHFINSAADAARRTSSSATAARSTNTWATPSWRSGTRRSTIPTMPATPAGRRSQMVARMEELNREWREGGRGGRAPVRAGWHRHRHQFRRMLRRQSRLATSASTIRRSATTSNLASRIEGLSKMYGVAAIVGEATVQRAGCSRRSRARPDARVKGRTRPTRIYTLAARFAPSQRHFVGWSRFIAPCLKRSAEAYGIRPRI